MQTRREQVRAYRFVTRRVVSALLSGEPETNDLPMRRLSMAIFGSVMIALLVFAGVGAYGLFRTTHTKPAQSALVIERETGARYVYLDNVLYPVLNYSSARLLLGTADPQIKTMSAGSLRGIPRGPVLGIPGAPDSLPPRDALLGLPWTVCSAPRSRDETVPSSQLLVGPLPPGGTDPGSAALYVASGRPTGQQYLIMRTRDGVLERFKLGRDVPGLLTLQGDPIVLSPALLEGIPAGPDLVKINLPKKLSGKDVAGQPAPLGQVYQVDQNLYAMLTVDGATGLVPIGPVTARLLSAPGVGQAMTINANQYAPVRLDAHYEPPGYPDALPRTYQVTNPAPAACVSYSGGDRPQTSVRVYDTDYDHLPDQLQATGDPTLTQIQRGTQSVDRVVVGGGHGALVRDLPGPDALAPGTTVYVITDQGVKFPISDSPDVLGSLGYGGVNPVPVSDTLLALLPTGPLLDPQAARGYTPPGPPSQAPATPSTAPPSPGTSAVAAPPAR